MSASSVILLFACLKSSCTVVELRRRRQITYTKPVYDNAAVRGTPSAGFRKRGDGCNTSVSLLVSSQERRVRDALPLPGPPAALRGPMDELKKRKQNFLLRLPISIREKATQIAHEDGTSLNHFVSLAVAEKLSRMDEAVRSMQVQPSSRPRTNPSPRDSLHLQKAS